MMTPMHNFHTDKNGIPVASKDALDNLGEKLVRDFCPEAAENPMRIDIERFVQEYLGMEQDYQHLTNNGVYLGMTVFNDTSMVPVYNPEKKCAQYIKARAGTVIIDTRLLEDRKKNRYRFTMGHEGSHGILHSGYFAYDPNQISICDLSDVPMIRCRNVGPVGKTRKPASQWTDNDRMEWQANRLSSAILMPREMVHKLADNFRANNTERSSSLEGFYPTRIVSLTSKIFDVSREAAAYRLRELGLVSSKWDIAVLTGSRDVMDIYVR